MSKKVIWSTRLEEWDAFSEKVRKHVVEYSVAQYGEKGSEGNPEWTLKAMAENIKKYCDRVGRNMRDGQQLLDFVKIGQYAAMMWCQDQEETTKDIKYRVKPTPIEVFKVIPNNKNFPAWLEGKIEEYVCQGTPGSESVHITLLSGGTAYSDEFIVCENGEINVYPKETFNKYFEKV